jgi:hypothetical protein
MALPPRRSDGDCIRAAGLLVDQVSGRAFPLVLTLKNAPSWSIGRGNWAAFLSSPTADVRARRVFASRNCIPGLTDRRRERRRIHH